jgi:alpha-1,6-mannosyltransferase
MTPVPAYRRPYLALLCALGFAVATQAALALGHGDAALSTRDEWTTALVLWMSLSVSALAVIGGTWTMRGIPMSRGIALAIVLAGIFMRAPYFGTGPMLEDDHFRYLLDGAMVARGLDPYAVAPVALSGGLTRIPPDLIADGSTTIAAISFPALRSIYPGGAQLLFALAHLAAPWSIDGLRAAIFAMEALTAILVWRLLVACGRTPIATTLYWCNPLMAFCLTGQAHVDAALGPPILAALLATHRRAGALAGCALGLAAGVKLWPILLAPLLARALGEDRRCLASFAFTLAGTTLVLCAPLLIASRGTDAGLVAYATGWSVNNAPYAWASLGLRHVLGPDGGESALRVLVVLAAAGASLVIAARPPRNIGDIVFRACLLAALLFYLSPAQFPWYAAWFLPLAAASAAWVAATATIGLPVYFLFFPMAASGQAALHHFGFAFLHLVPVLLIAYAARRRVRAGEAA